MKLIQDTEYIVLPARYMVRYLLSFLGYPNISGVGRAASPLPILGYGLGLPHTDSFFMCRVALRHNESGYNFDFYRCFILDVEKSACL